jgi:hypothetical protein
MFKSFQLPENSRPEAHEDSMKDKAHMPQHKMTIMEQKTPRSTRSISPENLEVFTFPRWQYLCALVLLHLVSAWASEQPSSRNIKAWPTGARSASGEN